MYNDNAIFAVLHSRLLETFQKRKTQKKLTQKVSELLHEMMTLLKISYYAS